MILLLVFDIELLTILSTEQHPAITLDFARFLLDISPVREEVDIAD